ncbi:hypothetical protein QX99_01794 [Weissella cibaria]|uniref:Uncharacterized protein n=1 Tax=Weissella cibaria TaxID=137591 RepID=A0A0D1JE38_9LACO|nr:hypothetical protein QX99_01794 [Weissella cibaria]
MSMIKQVCQLGLSITRNQKLVSFRTLLMSINHSSLGK